MPRLAGRGARRASPGRDVPQRGGAQGAAVSGGERQLAHGDNRVGPSRVGLLPCLVLRVFNVPVPFIAGASVTG